MPLRLLSLVVALAALLVAPAAATAAPPPNDSFSSAAVLSGTTASYSGNNSQANVALQAGEPDHAEFTDGIAARSVWFRWQAPAGVDETTISLCESVDTADSVLAVYTGTAVNSLTLVPGARNDDGCGAMFGPSEVSFTPVAGTTYRIAVADWDFDDGAINGPYELDLLPTPGVPGNDAFANAEVLTGTTDTFASNNIRATMETGEPNHASASGGIARKSVWFRWQAPAAGDATVSLCDSGETDDSVVAVYTGSAVDALTLPAVASDDDGCESEEGPSTVTWAASAGTTYRIAVANWDPDSGIGNGYELDFSFEPEVTDPPPDTQITGSQAFARTTTFGPTGFQTTVANSLGFEFTSAASDLGHYECLIDGTVVDADCESPYTNSDPPGGSHSFAVRAVDAAGNPDPDPATQGFTVDKSPPAVAITGGPANGSTTSDTTPSFTVSSEAGATFVCRLDSGDYEQCATGFDPPVLSEAEHTLEVYAIDGAGNVGGPDSRTFTVVSESAQACLDAQTALSDAEADLADADAAVAAAETRLQRAKQSGKRKRIRRAKAKLNAAKSDWSSADAAVVAAQQTVDENCG